MRYILLEHSVHTLAESVILASKNCHQKPLQLYHTLFCSRATVAPDISGPLGHALPAGPSDNSWRVMEIIGVVQASLRLSCIAAYYIHKTVLLLYLYRGM